MARSKMQEKVRADMKSLGVYKPEFEPTIEIYCQLRQQYDKLTTKFRLSGYKCEEYTATGTKKAPIVATLESLRKDILAYAAHLGLTAQGYLKLNDKAFAPAKKTSAFAKALADVGQASGQ